MQVKTGQRAGELTVYGADWCGWTKKQLAYLDAKGIPYTFVDCAKQTCPAFVDGFPTLVEAGKVLGGGYREL